MAKFTVEIKDDFLAYLRDAARKANASVEELLLLGAEDMIHKDPAKVKEDVADTREAKRRRERSNRLVHSTDPNDSGFDLLDPATGARYIECESCGQAVDEDDYHSGMECNLCHAMNKDD